MPKTKAKVVAKAKAKVVAKTKVAKAKVVVKTMPDSKPETKVIFTNPKKPLRCMNTKTCKNILNASSPPPIQQFKGKWEPGTNVYECELKDLISLDNPTPIEIDLYYYCKKCHHSWFYES